MERGTFGEVAFHEETLDAAILFRSKLNALAEKIDLKVARAYAFMGIKSSGLSEEDCNTITEIFDIRKNAISKEMHAHGVAQAAISGVAIPEDVLNGVSLSIGFGEIWYSNVPTMKVYELFMPYTVNELQTAK